MSFEGKTYRVGILSDFTGPNHQVIAVILVSFVYLSFFSWVLNTNEVTGIQKNEVNSGIGLKFNLTPYGKAILKLTSAFGQQEHKNVH